MTQSSVAISVDGASWVLLNASPDIRAQIQATPALHPRGLRDTPIAAVVLTNADVDHIAGLLTLREKTGFTVFGTADILQTLEANRIFDVMDRTLIPRTGFALEQTITPLPDLTLTPFAVPGKVALFLEGETVGLQEIGEQTIGLMIEDGRRKVAYIPGCAALPDWLVDRLRDVDLLLFDGTVWENDDMARTGTGEKTGARMGHLPMQGDMGSLARLAPINARKVFIHVNNTNPVLQPDGPERAALMRAGWEIARDGQEITP
ncbi:pyrroloquinoline quinone biosynthesis protein B [Ruegeria marina]|uniref:Coenzyme PQQ synthesis protein B n=2 Tax=Ruegeria marina TaxID=639004 RepID=A0A1G6ZMV7_9RHOB|nr:pyrroloquinoline quinone biosynthesis protein B [Ruegeria marina]